jgi:hypothetical protein
MTDGKATTENTAAIKERMSISLGMKKDAGLRPTLSKIDRFSMRIRCSP